MITAVGVTVSTANGAVRNVIKSPGRTDDRLDRVQIAAVHNRRVGLSIISKGYGRRPYYNTQAYASVMQLSGRDRRVPSRHMVQGTLATDCPVAVITLWTAPSPIHTCVQCHVACHVVSSSRRLLDRPLPGYTYRCVVYSTQYLPNFSDCSKHPMIRTTANR